MAADRDSGMDTDEQGVGAAVGQDPRAGGKRRRVFGPGRPTGVGPTESPIMPDPTLMRRRLDFE